MKKKVVTKPTCSVSVGTFTDAKIVPKPTAPSKKGKHKTNNVKENNNNALIKAIKPYRQAKNSGILEKYCALQHAMPASALSSKLAERGKVKNATIKAERQSLSSTLKHELVISLK